MSTTTILRPTKTTKTKTKTSTTTTTPSVSFETLPDDPNNTDKSTTTNTDVLNAAEKRIINRKLFPFNFYLYQKEEPNHIVILKDSRPKFKIVIDPSCDACTQMLNFFQVRHIDDGPMIDRVEFVEDVHEHHHQVIYQGIPLALESDDIAPKQIGSENDGANANPKGRPKGGEAKTRAKTKTKTKTKAKPKKLTSSMEWRLIKEFETTIGGTRKLLPHQQRLVEFVASSYKWNAMADKTGSNNNNSKNYYDPFLVYMLMGSGKTWAMLAALSQHPPANGRVLIVAPKTIVEYWGKNVEQIQYKNGTMLRFTVMGFSELARLCADNKDYVKDQVVVVDEFHEYRNLQDNMRYVIQCLKRAKALFLLSGTPMSHKPLEAEYLFEFMGAAQDYDPEATTPADLELLWRGRVFFYDPMVHDRDLSLQKFPRQQVVVEHVPLTWLQTFEYVRARAQKLNFGGYPLVTGIRNSYNTFTMRICNQSQEQPDEDSPKFRAILERLRRLVGSDPETRRKHMPIVIYSPYKELGVEGLRRRVEEAFPTLRSDIVSGDTDHRQNVIDRYNQGKLDVFFITKAANCGCDLMGTHQMWIVNPHAAKFNEDQTKNRACRFGSHDGETDACVVFTKFVSTFPKERPTPAEAEELKLLFEEKFMYGKKVTDIDVAEVLYGMVKGQPTVEEAYETKMIEEHKVLMPWVEALRRASIEFRIAPTTTTTTTTTSSSSSSSGAVKKKSIPKITTMTTTTGIINMNRFKSCQPHVVDI